MKKISHLRHIAIFAALLMLASCEKEPSCETCTLFLFNAEQYTYQMTVTGHAGFALKPAETKEVKISTGKTITVTGKPNTYYAHSDFSKSVKCEGECGDLLVVVEE